MWIVQHAASDWKKNWRGQEMLQVQQIKTWWMTSTTFYSFSLWNCLLIVGTEWAIAVCKGHNEEGHFVFDICQLLLKNHWSVCRRRAVTDKKHTFCALIQRCLFVGCVFPEKNPNHHGKKVMAGTRDDAVIRNSIQKPSTIFKAIILLRCAAKKFDPTCHNRQQHCHLTITGSQEKQINA